MIANKKKTKQITNKALADQKRGKIIDVTLNTAAFGAQSTSVTIKKQTNIQTFPKPTSRASLWSNE